MVARYNVVRIYPQKSGLQHVTALHICSSYHCWMGNVFHSRIKRDRWRISVLLLYSNLMGHYVCLSLCSILPPLGGELAGLYSSSILISLVERETWSYTCSVLPLPRLQGRYPESKSSIISHHQGFSYAIRGWCCCRCR